MRYPRLRDEATTRGNLSQDRPSPGELEAEIQQPWKMLPSRIWLGPAALMAATVAAAQNTTANSSSSSATSLTPAVVLMGFPSCAQSCALSAVQSAQCSLTDMTSLLDCFCTNITAQAELSTCAQLSCEIYDAGTSLYIENAMCAAYPKQSLVYVINTAAIVTFALAIPVVAARCAARWRLTKGLWSDDYMSIAATVFLIILGVIQLECGKVGFGLHIWNFDWNNSEKLLILDYVGQIAYIWVQITSKLAVLLLYYRVFKVAGSLWFRWTVRGCMAFKLLHGLIYTFVVIFQCSPVSAFWDTSITDAKCFNEGIIVFSGAVVSIAEDIALMILPISELRKLQVSGRKRWGVAIMFAFASFGTIASIVRLRYLLVLDESHDSTWNNVNIVVWSLIENLMAVVCGSLPALRPYVDPWIPRISVTWPKSRGSSKGTPKHTDNSTANSDTLYSPSTYGADYKKYSYPMPPRSPHNSYGRWKESHPVEEEDEEDQHQLDDLEVGLASVMVVSRKTPDLLERGRKSPDAIEQGQSSESETELIIQGNRASAAYSQNQRSSTGAKQN